MSNAVEIGQRPELLSASDLQMVYKVGKVEVPALRCVDLAVREGEFVAVMGPSGCGKSTLLHLLGGLLKPTAGRILVAGVEISAVNDNERTRIRRDKMGFIFQRFNLLPTLTAKDNIELARQIRNDGKAYNSNRTLEMLQFLGLKDKLDHKPSELSGGEQQRVAIARAVINRPAILLADEPTGSLDSGNSRTILQMLQELNVRYRQTIIMITHDPEAASTAKRIIEMRDGLILDRVDNLAYAMET